MCNLEGRLNLIVVKHERVWDVHVDWRIDHFTVVCSVTKFVFRCEANNSLQGIGTRNDTVLTVEGKVDYFKSHIKAISH